MLRPKVYNADKSSRVKNAWLDSIESLVARGLIVEFDDLGDSSRTLQTMLSVATQTSNDRLTLKAVRLSNGTDVDLKFGTATTWKRAQEGVSAGIVARCIDTWRDEYDQKWRQEKMRADLVAAEEHLAEMNQRLESQTSLVETIVVKQNSLWKDANQRLATMEQSVSAMQQLILANHAFAPHLVAHLWHLQAMANPLQAMANPKPPAPPLACSSIQQSQSSAPQAQPRDERQSGLKPQPPLRPSPLRAPFVSPPGQSRPPFTSPAIGPFPPAPSAFTPSPASFGVRHPEEKEEDTCELQQRQAFELQRRQASELRQRQAEEEGTLQLPPLDGIFAGILDDAFFLQ